MTKEVLLERYQANQTRLRKTALCMMKSTWDADDVLQIVFLKAWLNVEKLHSEKACDAWLMTICRNTCMDIKRQQTRRRETGLVEIADERSAENLLENLWLETMIGHLRIECAQAIRKFYFEGLSIDELSRFTGKPEGTVKGLLYQGRVQLKGAVQDEGAFI